jgi:hypothetical protein
MEVDESRMKMGCEEKEIASWTNPGWPETGDYISRGGQKSEARRLCVALASGIDLLGSELNVAAEEPQS